MEEEQMLWNKTVSPILGVCGECEVGFPVKLV